jgi:hypothetical protein
MEESMINTNSILGCFKQAVILVGVLVLPPILWTISIAQVTPIGVTLGPPITSPPYTQTFDSTKLPNGTYTLTAIATDTSGNTAESKQTLHIYNAAPPPPPPQDLPPQIYFITKDGVSFTGATKVIDLHVADNDGVHKCDLYLDGSIYQSIMLPQPRRLSATTKFYLQGILAKATYTLGASCYDRIGGKGDAAAINVTKR